MYLARCHHPDEIPASRICTVHSNSSAHTMWHWHFLCQTKNSFSKSKLSPHVEPGKASACYTNCNISQKKKKNPKKLRNNKWKVSHSSAVQGKPSGKEGDRGSEHKNHTTAFQVAHKEVPNQAGFLPGCSTSPQFLKPSNSTKTRSILSYRRVLASPLHTAQTTQAGGKTQKLYQRPDSKWQLRWVREEKKEI